MMRTNVATIVYVSASESVSEYQPSGKEGTRSMPANPKWPVGPGNMSKPRLLDPPNNFC